MSGLIRGVLTLLHHSVCLYPSAGGPHCCGKVMDFSVCLNSYQRGRLPSSLFFLTHLLLLPQPRAMHSGNTSNLHPRQPGPQWAHQLLPTPSAGYSRTEILQPFPRLSQGLNNKPSIPVVKESLTLSTIQPLSAPPPSFQGPPNPNNSTAHNHGRRHSGRVPGKSYWSVLRLNQSENIFNASPAI